MNLQDVQRKIKKLLNLAARAGADEAAAAAGQAQKLMDQYKVEAVGLEDETDLPDEDVERCPEPLEALKQIPSWKLRLASTLARANQCRALASSGTGIVIFGRPSDVGATRYLYQLIVPQLQRITKANCGGCGRTYANNFRMGCVDAVIAALAAQKDALKADMTARWTASQSIPADRALVRVESAIEKVEARGRDVDRWLMINVNVGTRRSYSRGNDSARAHGRQAGAAINTGGGSRAALGSGRRQIG